MKVLLQIGERSFAVDTSQSVSLARPLDFQSPHADFGAPPARREPLRIGSFLADTRQGGGCNVDQLSLIPHCHGTHTETVGHIVDEPVPISAADFPLWMVCALLTVTTRASEQTDEEYEPPSLAGDSLITAAELRKAYQSLGDTSAKACWQAYVSQPAKALIVRCQPSVTASSGVQPMPPYFSTAAIRWCHDLGVCHLLVESPSIDRLEDGGRLTNHHAYWNVAPGTHTLTPASWTHKSITESICVSTQIADGIYLLDLQVPAFGSDAAPSRPVILPIDLATSDQRGESK